MQTSLMIEIGGLLIMSAATLKAAASATALAGRRMKLSRLNKEYLREFDQLAARSFRAQSAKRLTHDQAWQGTRKFRVERRIYEDHAQSVCSFYLVPYDGRPLPPFEAGQFLTFKLAVPGQKQEVVRCYSLTSNPTEQRYYRVSIKRLAGAPGDAAVPPGIASNHFHDHLQEGAIVEAFAPSGDFVLDPNSEKPIVFIAGGVGLTPFMSMLHQLSAEKSPREVWLFYGTRNSTEHLMRGHLEHARKYHPKFRTVIAYSRPTSACRRGVDYDVAGHIGVPLMEPLLKARECEIYVCGPGGMIDTVTRDLAHLGVPQENVKLERFAEATTEQTRAPVSDRDAESGGRFKVAFARSGVTGNWSAKGGSLLEFAEAEGIKARCGCRQGICGMCATPVRQGEVTYLSRPAKEPAQGTCLPCITQPKSDLVLEL